MTDKDKYAYTDPRLEILQQWLADNDESKIKTKKDTSYAIPDMVEGTDYDS